MAAHLVAQERFGGLHLVGVTPAVVLLPATVRDRVRRWVLEGSEDRLVGACSYELLLDRLDRRPPVAFLAPALVSTRLVEMWVHHEDVRRVVDTQARSSDTAVGENLWRALALISRRLTLPQGVSVRLALPEGRAIRRGNGPHTVTMTGVAGELLLAVLGRTDVAGVQFDGPADAVQRLRSWRLL